MSFNNGDMTAKLKVAEPLEEGTCVRCEGTGYDPEDTYLEPPHGMPMPEACRFCRGTGLEDDGLVD